jgi:hypothetical protein
MAYQDTHHAMATDLPHRLLDGTKAVLSAIGGAIVASSTANRRLKAVERLNEKSDAELAAMGIRREEIVRRVFIDLMDI